MPTSISFLKVSHGSVVSDQVLAISQEDAEIYCRTPPVELACPAFPGCVTTIERGGTPPSQWQEPHMIRKQQAVVGAVVSFGLGLSAWLTFMPGRSDAG